MKIKFEDIWYYVYIRGIRRLIPKYQNRTMFTRFFWRALKDRLVKGYDESELWSLDCSLTKLIAPRIRDFANDFELKGGGIPFWILDEERKASMAKGYAWNKQYCCLADKKEDQRCFKRAAKRWLTILKEIADGFEDMELEDRDWCAWVNKWQPAKEKWQNKLDKAKTFKEKQVVWNQIGSFREYKEGFSVSEDDVTYCLHQRAMDLLYKHYHSLWQ